MISNCGHDEHGKYSGGQAGDQTGQEWAVIPWYNRPWGVVLRFPNPDVRDLIAQLAMEAAENNLIGYDQGQRTTFWTQLTRSGFRPANIKTACEADCSAGVAAIVKAAGNLRGIDKLKKIPEDMYTGNEKDTLKNAGFSVLTDSKYLKSDKYLLRGDILLLEGHHTAINLTDGALSDSEDKGYAEGWKKSSDGRHWMYQYASGQYATGWKTLSSKTGKHWYYFDQNGYMLTGWQQINVKWYYLDTAKDFNEGACWISDGSGAQSVWTVS